MEPPIPHSVKVNFDATINKEKDWIEMEGRNHKWEVIFVWTEITEDQDPLIANGPFGLRGRKGE